MICRTSKRFDLGLKRMRSLGHVMVLNWNNKKVELDIVFDLSITYTEFQVEISGHASAFTLTWLYQAGLARHLCVPGRWVST